METRDKMKKSQLQKLIREQIFIINELKVEDPELQKKVDEFADLSDQIDRISTQLKQLNDKYKGIAVELTPLIEEAKDNALETEKNFVKIKKAGYERKSIQYKPLFEWLFSKVNRQMKALIEQALELHTKISKVPPQLAVQKKEGIGDIFSKLRGFISKVISRIKGINKEWSNTNKEFLRKARAIK